jgi:type IV fimbrial biogenesis protein FimT
MKSTKGFALIELMITLTIVGVLLSYGLPNFHQLKLNKTMDSERNRLTSSLHFARIHAINNQRYVVVCPSINGENCDNNSNWYSGWIIFQDINKNRQLDDQDILLKHEDKMIKGIIATSSKYRKIIRYNGMGFSPGTNLSINFCDSRGKKHAKSIILNNAGRIKQSKPISDNVCN